MLSSNSLTQMVVVTYCAGMVRYAYELHQEAPILNLNHRYLKAWRSVRPLYYNARENVRRCLAQIGPDENDGAKLFASLTTAQESQDVVRILGNIEGP